MKLRCAIVDDEKLAREGLRILLKKCDAFDLEIVGEGSSAQDAVQLVKENSPDLLFLDINMPEEDGFDALRNMDQSNLPLVVFVTAYTNFAVKGFDANAVDYLLKPVNQLRLIECLRRVHIRKSEKHAQERTSTLARALQNPKKVSVQALTDILVGEDDPLSLTIVLADGPKRVRVEVDDIICIQAAGDYMCVTTQEREFVHRSTMKKLLNTLGTERFVQIHRSTTVNIDHVTELVSLGYSRYNLVMANGSVVRSSKHYRSGIKRIAQGLML